MGFRRFNDGPTGRVCSKCERPQVQGLNGKDPRHEGYCVGFDTCLVDRTLLPNDAEYLVQEVAALQLGLDKGSVTRSEAVIALDSIHGRALILRDRERSENDATMEATGSRYPLH